MPHEPRTSTLGRARLGFESQAEIDTFVSTLGRFERGEITSEEWKSFRLVHGMYGQRQDEAQMLRVKIPQGILSADQVRAIADVAESYSRGFAHVTTRQNVQFHFLELRDVEPAMRRLAAGGLTTREACGNSVRSITACPYSGVAADEPFDVSPYAEALTRHLLRHPLSSTLPRKFKIAFEGCSQDHAVTAIHDLGFRARVLSGRRGFRVLAGGGTGILPTAAKELFEFLPASELLDLATAVLRVYHARGDRQNRERNRMKFLIRAVGFSNWKSEVLREFEEVKKTASAALPFVPEEAPEEGPPDWARPPAASVPAFSERGISGPGLLPVLSGRSRSFAAFQKTNVRPQRQPGFSTVAVTLPLGDVTASQLHLVAAVALSHGDGTVRLTQSQDLLFRWVPDSEVPTLFERLEAAGLGLDAADTISDVTSCPGAESCRLAVTHSRGLGRLPNEHLTLRDDSAALAPSLQLKVSGCPNGCAQHHIAGIGFQGSVRQLDGKAVPQYFVMTGGEITESETHFAKTVAKVPARRVPQAVERLLELFRDEARPEESPAAFFRRVGAARQKQVLAPLEALTAETAAPEDYVDPGQEGDGAFTVDVKPGECAA